MKLTKGGRESVIALCSKHSDEHIKATLRSYRTRLGEVQEEMRNLQSLIAHLDYEVGRRRREKAKQVNDHH